MTGGVTSSYAGVQDRRTGAATGFTSTQRPPQGEPEGWRDPTSGPAVMAGAGSLATTVIHSSFGFREVLRNRSSRELAQLVDE